MENGWVVVDSQKETFYISITFIVAFHHVSCFKFVFHLPVNSIIYKHDNNIANNDINSTFKLKRTLIDVSN